ncbi:MAG TPA: FAD:protein FMN transferase [Allosphingosinicella sp.]|nr:FAD:protein FMN transferase [Allosphingosinicella sp.]
MLRRCRPLLGTFVEVTADREDAIERVFDAVAQVHRLMSAHEPESDLSRINRFAHLQPVQVHPETASLLERALFWARESGGAFDPVRAGKAAVEHGFIPLHADQPGPAATSWRCLKLQGRSVRLDMSGCVDLGGIAKGFAVDRAVVALRSAGCERGLVNAGGDIRGFGPEVWPVRIVEPMSRRPVAQVRIADEAMATSGGLPAGEGLGFDHLGGPNDWWTSVSVVAPTACDADALTKIAWMRGNAVLSFGGPGVRALAVTRGGEVESINAPEMALA